MSNTEYREIILASLMHDIGKLVYRTKTEKGKHEELGELFYNEYVAKIPAFKELGNVRSLILSHHDKSARDAILSKADGLSAGEREESTDTFTLAPLRSIFQNVNLPNKGLSEGVYYYKPAILSWDSIMPLHVTSLDDLKTMETELAKNYQGVLTALESDLHLMNQISDFNAAIDTLLIVLEKHLSLVPSAGYKNIPDVSLYDHLKMTAAIASCLYLSKNGTEPFLLVEGDISGIQKYIYQIRGSATEGLQMSKRLRGRSFELYLTTDAIIQFLLKKLGLPNFHLVFHGGGNFILIIPNTSEAIDVIHQSEGEINRFLLQEHNGLLGVVLGFVKVKEADLNEFGECTKELKTLLANKKQRKFQGLLEDSFFGPYEFDEDASDVCPICGKDYLKGTGGSCQSCRLQVEIGNIIPSRSSEDYNRLTIIRAINCSVPLTGHVCLPLTDLGVSYYFARDREEEKSLIGRLKSQGVSRVDLLSVNTINFLYEYKGTDTIPVSYGFVLAGTQVPVERNVIMSFEHISKRRDDGYPLISFMRLDVDNLGYIFGFGLKHHTISRFSSLSRSMNTFFLWYINKIAETHSIYVTYSGGDDLFVAGHWKDIIEFSLDLREAFRSYTCNNESLTLSGGIAIFKPNFPIQYGAEIAGEREHQSKNKFVINHITKERTIKDAITIFDHTITWKRFGELTELYSDLLDILEGNNNSTVDSKFRIKASLVYKINTLARRFRKQKDYLEGKWISEIMHIIKYIFARRGMNYSALEGDHSDNSGASQRARIAKRLMESDVLIDLVVPASMIIYSVRKD